MRVQRPANLTELLRHSLHGRGRLFPFAVLAAGLLSTTVVSGYVAATARAQDEARFQNAVQATQDRIEARLEAHLALLRGGSGFWAGARSDISLRDFAAYVARLELRLRHPGMQGIGITLRLDPWAREELAADMERQGQPGFRIWPEHPRDEYHAIVFLEPLDRRNQAAIGFDMFTEPTRREAMERARDTGMPAMSGKVTLVQEIDEDKQAGFLIYLPLYRGGGGQPRWRAAARPWRASSTARFGPTISSLASSAPSASRGSPSRSSTDLRSSRAACCTPRT
jgi:CHASE1-domain containing sensor protein